MQSTPSPSSVAMTSFRTRRPPNVSECDENVPPRAACSNMLAMWNASDGFFLQLVVIDHGVDAEPDLSDGVRERGALTYIAFEHGRL